MADESTRPGLRTLAVCVDDYGLHDGINTAVLDLALNGRITATSCMVGAPAWKGGLQALRRLRDDGRIDIGLHLDLTEHPFDAGCRQPLRSLILLAGARRIDHQRLRTEIRAQFEAFEYAMGSPPDHVDGHQHIHQLPGVRDLLMEVLMQRDAAVRPWLRSTRRPAGPGLPINGRFKPWVIERLGGAAFDRLARDHVFRQNHHLLGVYDFARAALPYRQRLEAWLAIAQDGDLLMCHPSAGAADVDAISAARLNEYQTLSGPALPGLLAHAGVRLARLGVS